MILEMWKHKYILREMKDRQDLYSENDFWAQDGNLKRSILMTAKTLLPLS